MAEIKESFDINLKIQNVVQTYLTEGNNQGKFITPTYHDTGYEIAYINSDGEDYVSSKPTPAFVQQIQTAQEKNETSEIDDSPLITTEQIDESMVTNNTSPQGEDKIPLIE